MTEAEVGGKKEESRRCSGGLSSSYTKREVRQQEEVGLLKAGSMIGLLFKCNAILSPRSLSTVVKDLSKYSSSE